MSSERRDRSGAVSVRLKLPQPNLEIALSVQEGAKARPSRAGDSALPGSLSVVSQMPKVVCSTSNLTAGFPRLVARTLRIVEISPLIGPLAWTVRLGVDSRRKVSRPSAALTRARSTPNGNPSRFTSTVHRPVAVPLEPGSIPVAVEPVGREGPGTIFRPTIRRPRLLTKGRIGDGERPRVIQGQRWRFSIPRGPLASLGVPSTATPP